jgi:hypothetical protein
MACGAYGAPIASASLDARALEFGDEVMGVSAEGRGTAASRAFGGTRQASRSCYPGLAYRKMFSLTILTSPLDVNRITDSQGRFNELMRPVNTTRS